MITGSREALEILQQGGSLIQTGEGWHLAIDEREIPVSSHVVKYLFTNEAIRLVSKRAVYCFNPRDNDK